jgi:hypothetical protein
MRPKTKKPRLPEAKVRAILEANGVTQARSPVAVVAIRGYYLDSMGEAGANDRRIYDDAHFVCWPDGYLAAQANTDPNGYRAGHGTGARKGMAMLKTGIHRYGTGLHRGRVAFRQCEKFTVLRDGEDGPYEHTGWHAINWHSGSGSSTSSLGCQTNPPDVWATLRPHVYRLLEHYHAPQRKNDWGASVRSFDYVLIDETARRRGDLLVSARYL